MSNSEVGNGGVGTLRFNATGALIGYERTLTGTSRNCGEGRKTRSIIIEYPCSNDLHLPFQFCNVMFGIIKCVTYWNTWVPCKENGRNGNEGFCFEVDPHSTQAKPMS